MDPQLTDEMTDEMTDQLTDGQVEELSEAFMLFAKDGKIQAAELASVIAALGHEPTEEELTEMIHEIGAVLPEGTITFPEFCGLMSRQVECEDTLQEVFDSFASNNNGFISAAELRYVMDEISGQKLTDEEMLKMMPIMDQNGDGLISYEDFRKGLADESSDHRPSDFDLQLCGFCCVYYEASSTTDHCCDSVEIAHSKMIMVDSLSDLSTEVPDDLSMAGDLVSEASSNGSLAESTAGSWMPSLPSFHFEVSSSIGKLRKHLFKSMEKKGIEVEHNKKTLDTQVQDVMTTGGASNECSSQRTPDLLDQSSQTIPEECSNEEDEANKDCVCGEEVEANSIMEAPQRVASRLLSRNLIALGSDIPVPATSSRDNNFRKQEATGSDEPTTQDIEHEAAASGEAPTPKPKPFRRLIRLGSADSAVSDGNSKSDSNNEQEEVASSGVSSPKRGLLWSIRAKPALVGTVVRL